MDIDYKSVNQNRRLSESYMTYFNASVNRKGNIHIRDCTNLSEKLVTVFSKHSPFGSCRLQMDLNESFDCFLESGLDDLNINRLSLSHAAVKTTVARVLDFIKIYVN